MPLKQNKLRKIALFLSGLHCTITSLLKITCFGVNLDMTIFLKRNKQTKKYNTFKSITGEHDKTMAYMKTSYPAQQR